MMIRAEPCEAVYHALVRIYLNNLEKIALSTCISGILYNKGFINDLDDFHQLDNMKELKKIFKNAPLDEKKRLIKKIEKGEFDEYKYLE